MFYYDEGFRCFRLNFKQAIPEELRTSLDGRLAVLKPKALQPRG